MGRGACESPLQSNPSTLKPRGRGRLTSSEKEYIDKSAIFKREIHLKRQLQNVFGMESYHSNELQRQYWHGEQTQPQDECFLPGTHSPEMFDDAETNTNSSSFTNSPVRSWKSSSSSPAPQVYPPLSHCSSAPQVYPPLSDCTPAPLVSPPPLDCSPAPQVYRSSPMEPTAQPSPRGAVRKRGSRIAANFSNPCEDDEPIKSNAAESEVFTCAEPSRAPFGFRKNLPRDFSINSLNPTHRILENLFESDNHSSASSYTFKHEDFPPLK